jgi:hypothetical protein
MALNDHTRLLAFFEVEVIASLPAENAFRSEYIATNARNLPRIIKYVDQRSRKSAARM